MTQDFARQEAQRRSNELGTTHYAVNASMRHDSPDTWIVTTTPSKRYFTSEPIEPQSPAILPQSEVLCARIVGLDEDES